MYSYCQRSTTSRKKSEKVSLNLASDSGKICVYPIVASGQTTWVDDKTWESKVNSICGGFCGMCGTNLYKEDAHKYGWLEGLSIFCEDCVENVDLLNGLGIYCTDNIIKAC